MAMPLGPYPPPLERNGHRNIFLVLKKVRFSLMARSLLLLLNFFLVFKKVSFSLMAQPLPLLLMARSLAEEFLRLS